ncbi:MAG: hypothetical protein HOP34_13630 [Methylococcaceae bacterium]|nr:hypothetical protein [Methylococcaceae bacterium]
MRKTIAKHCLLTVQKIKYDNQATPKWASTPTKISHEKPTPPLYAQVLGAIVFGIVWVQAKNKVGARGFLRWSAAWRWRMFYNWMPGWILMQGLWIP